MDNNSWNGSGGGEDFQDRSSFFIIREMNIMTHVNYHYCVDWFLWEAGIKWMIDLWNLLGRIPVKDQG